MYYLFWGWIYVLCKSCLIYLCLKPLNYDVNLLFMNNKHNMRKLTVFHTFIYLFIYIFLSTVYSLYKYWSVNCIIMRCDEIKHSSERFAITRVNLISIACIMRHDAYLHINNKMKCRCNHELNWKQCVNKNSLMFFFQINDTLERNV